MFGNNCYWGGCEQSVTPDDSEVFTLPKQGQTPLPKTRPDIDYQLPKHHNDSKLTTTSQSSQDEPNWTAIKELLAQVQRESDKKYVALFSVHDTTKEIFDYYTQPLHFSDSAMAAAKGKPSQHYLYKLKEIDGAPPLVMAAYLPGSPLIQKELEYHLRGGENEQQTNPAGKVGTGDRASQQGCEWETILQGGWICFEWKGDTSCTYEPPVMGFVCDIGGGGGGGGDWSPEEECWPRDCFGGGGGGNGDTSCPTGYVRNASGTCVKEDPESDSCNTSSEEIGNAFPNASTTAKKELAEAIEKHGAKFGIDTKEEVRHFLSQAGHETGGFESLNVTESTYYRTPSLLIKNYPSKFSQTDTSLADPDNYLKNSKKVANVAYCCKYGNGTERSGDGWKYRGRGTLQLTWQVNYKAFTSFYQSEFSSSKDFVENPELIKSDSDLAIFSGMWYFKTRVIDAGTTIDSTDQSVKDITKAIRGVERSWKERKEIYIDIKSQINCDN